MMLRKFQWESKERTQSEREVLQCSNLATLFVYDVRSTDACSLVPSVMSSLPSLSYCRYSQSSYSSTVLRLPPLVRDAPLRRTPFGNSLSSVRPTRSFARSQTSVGRSASRKGPFLSPHADVPLESTAVLGVGGPLPSPLSTPVPSDTTYCYTVSGTERPTSVFRDRKERSSTLPPSCLSTGLSVKVF